MKSNLCPGLVFSVLLGIVCLGSATQAMAARSLIAAGGSFAMATASNGELYAWGQNGYGQLGNGPMNDYWGAVKLPSGVTPTAVAAAEYFSLAIGDDGKLYAWGYNGSGDLGNGTRNASSTPVVVSLPAGVTPKAVAAGGTHCLAIGSDGKLYAWGQNNAGQLGNGTRKDSSTPVAVDLPSGVMPTAVSAGVDFNLAIGGDGKLYAWGQNGLDQLGNGSTIESSSTPVVVRLPAGVTPKAAAAGHIFGLAVGSDGKYYAWGSGVAVDPGQGDPTFHNTPIVLSFMSHISQLVPSGYVPEPVPLAQTASPITREYPGVDASVQGIRTGMTVSQVEAIAAKRGLGRPSENKKQLSVKLPNVLTLSDQELQVYSEEYAYHVSFQTADQQVADVWFSSPATGNRSDAISLHTPYPADPKMDPFTVDALAAKLLRKYGPPSFQVHGEEGRYLWWDFDNQSLLKTCNTNIACFPYPEEFDFSSILTYDSHRPNEIHPNFYVVAWIHANRLDHAKAGGLDLSLGDVQFATLDRGMPLKRALAQLKATAEKDIADIPERAARKKQEKKKAELKLVPKF